MAKGIFSILNMIFIFPLSLLQEQTSFFMVYIIACGTF